MKENKAAIVEINRLIEENGGANCGWSSGKDHSDYCKVRIRHQGRVESVPFFEECQIVIPLRTQEEIRIHNGAYSVYLKLESRKKEILGQYNANKKEKSRLEAIHRSQQLEAKESEQREDPVKAQILNKRKKELVEKWRRERTTKVLIGEDRAEEQAKARTQEEQARRAKEEAEKRRQVQEYKEMKEIRKAKEEQREQCAKEQAKRYISADQRQRIEAKEQQIVERKLQVVQSKRAKEEMQAARQEQEMLEKAAKYPFVI